MAQATVTWVTSIAPTIRAGFIKSGFMCVNVFCFEQFSIINRTRVLSPQKCIKVT